MDEAIKQPLVLRAMTLHGFGPYLRGARLEIRPLTILCGKNGSGKSTWFKALNALQQSCRDGKFPFSWSVEDEWSMISFTNAFYWTEDRDEENDSPIDASSDDFGPPCTVGLEFEAREPLAFSEFSCPGADPSSAAQSMLWFGRCAKGTKLRVRVAHHKHHNFPDGTPLSAVEDWIEVATGDRFQHVVRASRDWGSRAYRLSCSKSVLPGMASHGNDQLLLVASFRQGDDPKSALNVVSLHDDVDAELAAALASVLIQRVTEIVSRFIDGFFPLSAIRVPHKYVNLNEAPLKLDSLYDYIALRHVGSEGEGTWGVLLSYQKNRLLPAFPHPSQPMLTQLHKVGGYVQFWLGHLIEGVDFLARDSSEWRLGVAPTNGFIEDNLSDQSRSERWNWDLELLEHRLFGSVRRGTRQPPGEFSAGFHQMLPIIVQTGVMQPNEVLAIENPEVHLHPSLQLEVAEFLLHQAQAGKIILVETHCDLIVRRILRAILEENVFDQPLSQEMVRIYFAGLEVAPLDYETATLEPLRINRHGQIENWPPGFMDDDVLESRRLLDAMYGPTENDDGIEAGEEGDK